MQITIKNLFFIALWLSTGTIFQHIFFPVLPSWGTVLDICYGSFIVVLSAWVYCLLSTPKENTQELLENVAKEAE